MSASIYLTGSLETFSALFAFESSPTTYHALGFVCQNERTATDVVTSREALMGNKNKESKGTKRAAEKSLKEKRRAKKAKKASQHSASTDSLDKTFGH